MGVYVQEFVGYQQNLLRSTAAQFLSNTTTTVSYKDELDKHSAAMFTLYTELDQIKKLDQF